VQEQPMIAAVNCAMDDHAAIKTDRSVHSLRFAERCALDGWIGRTWPWRELFGSLIDVKLTVTASARRRWHGHARLLVHS
jgi:hypothetical protein